MRLETSGLGFRIILWVARNSYGRQQAQYTPFSWRGIARDLGADNRGVARAGAILLSRGVLRKNDDGEIGVNKRALLALVEAGTIHPGDNSPRGHQAPEAGTPDPAPILIVKEREKGALEAKGFTAKDLLELYNERAGTLGLSKARGLTPDRQRHAAARIAEEPKRETWLSAFEKISVSAFLRGQNDRKWRADFDWLVKPGSLTKLLEGKYGNGAVHSPATGPRGLLADPATAAHLASRGAA